MDERLSQLAEIFQDVFDDDSLSISAETEIAEIEGWDSLIHITLMAAIQDEFGVSYDIDEITELKTVGDIIASLDRKS